MIEVNEQLTPWQSGWQVAWPYRWLGSEDHCTGVLPSNLTDLKWVVHCQGQCTECLVTIVYTSEFVVFSSSLQNYML